MGNRRRDGGCTVWIDEGLWACCGEPFSVGETVRWDLQEVSADDGIAERLAGFLPAGEAARVTHDEDHHGMHSHGVQTTGVVRGITAVFCRHAPTAERIGPQGAVVHAPVAGSGVLEQWRTSRSQKHRASLPGSGELEHVGYLVELAALPGAPAAG